MRKNHLNEVHNKILQTYKRFGSGVISDIIDNQITIIWL